MRDNTIKSVAIIGMGALGLLYGSQILDSGKDVSVTYVMDLERVHKYQNRILSFNGVSRVFPMMTPEAGMNVDLLMVAVKYNALPEAIRLMEPLVGKDTIIMSVLNGISSEEEIARVYGMEHLIYTVAQGTDAIKIGEEFRYTQSGHLHIGAAFSEQQNNLERVIAFFEEVKMPHIIEKDILYRMWSKFMMNVGVNQSSMIYEAGYGRLCQQGEANLIMIAAMREVIAIAAAKGITIREEEIHRYVTMMGTLDPESMPSMAQDRRNRRPSEVQMFAGTVIRLAAEQNILVPVNQYMYQKVLEIEHQYGKEEEIL